MISVTGSLQTPYISCILLMCQCLAHKEYGLTNLKALTKVDTEASILQKRQEKKTRPGNGRDYVVTETKAISKQCT